MFQENCYVASDDTGECVIIDCGAFFPEEKKPLPNISTITNWLPNGFCAPMDT